MSVLTPLLSAISDSSATILDKLNLNIKKIDGKVFTSVLFLFMAFVALPLLFFFKTGEGALSPAPVAALLFIIIMSALQNTLFYVGLEKRDLSYLEPVRNSEPIWVILLAFLVFPSERNGFVLILGFITTAALIYSSVNMTKLKIDKYLALVLLSIMLSGVLQIAYKYILGYYSPISVYAVRAIGVAILLFILFKPNKAKIQNKQKYFFALSALLYSAAAILKYVSISAIGVSMTILILASSPAMIYFFSKILLKEKLDNRKIISSVVIIGCVIAAAAHL